MVYELKAKLRNQVCKVNEVIVNFFELFVRFTIQFLSVLIENHILKCVLYSKVILNYNFLFNYLSIKDYEKA